MMRKFMASVVFVAGAALALAPAAHADDPAADPNDYSLQNANFVNYTDPAALSAQQNGKQIIVSPYGTANPIACKGNGTTVPLFDCMQHDDFGWFPLSRTDLPQLGTAWVHVV